MPCPSDSERDGIFDMMQGENWGPDKEAHSLIPSLGLDHTSMSVGDVIETTDGIHIVMPIGWDYIPK